VPGVAAELASKGFAITIPAVTPAVTKTTALAIFNAFAFT
jgi:hypothetical protein